MNGRESGVVNTALGLARAIAGRMATEPAVTAVALGGSIATRAGDERSDIDLYVFGDAPPPVEVRRAIATAHDPRPEIGNTAFGPSDEWSDGATGIGVDLIYWSPGWIEDQLGRVLDRHEASVGYSTAFWFTIRHLRPHSDRDGWLGTLLAKAEQPYPEPLRRAIIALNHPLLRAARSSFLHQIDLAIARDDPVSVQHRTAALLASYTDVLFALNRQPHPGEKRVLRQLAARCSRLPSGFETDVLGVLAATAAPVERELIGRLNGLVDALDPLLDAEGFVVV
ncbi:MAG: DUF4037 domain-containing protein [Chloroflexia bacterium]|nr:DUF4037 domain-containing protein [Chloroflexia bacterium]